MWAWLIKVRLKPVGVQAGHRPSPVRITTSDRKHNEGPRQAAGALDVS